MPNSFPTSSMIAAVPVVVELSSSDNGSINVSDFIQFGLDLILSGGITMS
jgi:hypothetical protein